MRAYANINQSCYADSVLVAMFAPTDAFHFMVGRPTTTVSDALMDEIRVLTTLDDSPATCAGLRNAMGGAWATPHAQSAVDFMHALLDACAVTNIGTQEEHTRRVYTSGRTETSVQSGVGFRIHTVVAGLHTTLLGAFVDVTEPGSGSVARVTTTITPTVAPVLVFEVARAGSAARVDYAQLLEVDTRTYSLVGVVCLRDAHYSACVHVDGAWWWYDDTHRGGEFVGVRDPEAVHASKFGELFIYICA